MQPPKRLVIKTIFLGGVFATLLALMFGGGILYHFAKDLPKIITVSDYKPPLVTRILTVDSQELGEFYKERRYLVDFEKIPTLVIQAFISAEDDRFFEHSGVNFVSILRASIANFKAGHVVQGGSTITQQVAKSLLLTPERSLDRKIKEVILANRIERNLTKQQILFLYLNQIYLGHGAYGIQAASRAYFRKDVSELTVPEAALLAGMPQAPSKYSPFLNPKRAKERQTYVLRRMLENGYIDQKQFEQSQKTALKIFHDEDLNTKYQPYLVEHIRRYLLEKYGEKTLYEEGLQIQVPLTREIAKRATESLRTGLKQIDKRMGYRGAIQHLKTEGEQRAFLRETEAHLVQSKLKHQLFLPEGRLSFEAALEAANFSSPYELLEVGESYPALVEGFDSKKRTASVSIGALNATLPIEGMRWAKPVRDEKNSITGRFEPTTPSQILKVGDVISAQVVRAGPDLIVALDQDPLIQGALFSIEVQTGKVLALVGGYDFEKSEFNRATQAMRQLGSVFKPVIYSAALEKGFTPASIIVDSPIVFEDSEGAGKWKPNNFEKKFYGDTSFRQALIKSRNIPTIKIVQLIGVSYLMDYTKRLGMQAPLNADLSVALGSSSSTLFDLVKIFAVFPRLGQKVEPVLMSHIMDRTGTRLEDRETDSAWEPLLEPPKVSESPTPPLKVALPAYPLPNHPDQVLDPRVAYVMNHLMKEAVTFGTGQQARTVGRIAAGKTGTTSDYNDAWFVGFTPHVLTGVWVGFDSQKSIGPAETGARAALPIWLDFMKDVVKNYPAIDFPLPQGVVFANIDPTSGKLATAKSSLNVREAFIDGTEPTETAERSAVSSDTQSDFFKEDRE